MMFSAIGAAVLCFLAALISITFTWAATHDANRHNYRGYIKNHCELISNHKGTNYWYECPATQKVSPK